MGKNVKQGLVLFLLAIATSSILAAPYTVTVATDKREYAPGDQVTVSVSITPKETVVLLWELKDPAGIRRDFGQVTCMGGSCSFSFRTRSDWPTGTYNLIVAVSGTNDKGYATFTLRVPTVPSPPPSAPPSPPPAAVDYELLSRVRIDAAARSLNELNATLNTLSSIMSQLNLTLNPEYLEQLNKAAETLRRAIDSYNRKDYENAYTLANSAYQAIKELIERVSSDTIQTLRSVVNVLLARAKDPTTIELLNAVDKELASASPNDRDILTKLAVTGRILVVVARAFKVPELERGLTELSKKTEMLESIAKSLNQTNIELQAQLIALQLERAELAKHVENLTSTVSELKGELDRVRQSNTELSNENLQLKEQLFQSIPRNISITAAVAALAAGVAVGVSAGKIVGKRKTSG